MEEWPSIGSGMLGHISMQIPVSTKVPDFDPVALMVKRKQQQDNPENISVINYDENEINELESFCRKYGILGFDCGKMNPKTALRMLKMRMGVPLEDNVSENKIKTLLKG